MYRGVMAFQFQLVAGSPALNFANTLDYRFDPERTIELMSSYERLVDFTQQSELISRNQARRLKSLKHERAVERALQHAIQLREVIESVFRALLARKAPDESSVEDLNRFLVRAREHERFYWKSGRLTQSFEALEGNPESPTWLLAVSTAALLTSPELAHVRACHEPSCR